jgi:competence protein ComEA
VVWLIAAVLGGIALMRVGGCGDDAGSGGGVRIARSPAPSDGSSQRADGGSRPGIYVHVAGAVRRPGLLRLPEGARVAAAVDRAGGPQRKADLSGVNLAAKLEDGQQVVVPRRGAIPGVAGSPAAAPGTAPPGSAGAPKLSLGAVTVEQLDELDGIGPTLAQRIVEYRTEHGGFRSLGELREVEGIGEKRFASLREALQP